MPYRGIAALAISLGVVVLAPDSPNLQRLALWSLVAIAHVLMILDLRVGLALVVVGAAVSPDYPMFGMPLRIEDLLLPGMCLVFFLRHVGKREPLKETLVGGPFALLMFFSVFSTLLGAIASAAPLTSESYLHTLKLIEYFVIFYLVVNIVRSFDDIKAMFLVLVFGSSLLVVYGYFQPGRTSGPEGETANIMGGYMLFHMLLVLGVLAVISDTRLRVFSYLYFLISLYPFFRTGSRTTYIAIGVTGMLLSILFRKRAFVVALIALGIAVGIFAGSREFGERITSLANPTEDSSFKARVSALRIQWREVLQYPVFGKGKGRVALGNVDNEYMKNLVETGFVGLGIFIWFLARVFRAAFRAATLGAKYDNTLQALVVGYIGGTMGLCIHAMGATTFTTIRTMVPFYFATGLVVAAMQLLTREDDEQRARQFPSSLGALRLKVREKHVTRRRA